MVFKRSGRVFKRGTASSRERGAELVEFIGFMPWILIVGLIIWQFMVFGHAMLTTGNAARQGARAAAANRSPEAAVAQAVGTYPYEIGVGARCGGSEEGGEPVAVTVRIRLPLISIPFVSIPDIWTTSTAIMRCEPIRFG